MLWAVAAAVVVVAALTVTLVVALSGDSEPEGRTFAQYSYKFVAPSDWRQTGDNVAGRQVVVKPADAQGTQYDDLVVVQEFELAYDAGTDRAKLARALQTSIGEHPEQYGQFQEHHAFAGKDTIHYVETKASAKVDWYVLAKGSVQVSIGCQEADEAQRVRTACEQIVGTLEFTN